MRDDPIEYATHVLFTIIVALLLIASGAQCWRWLASVGG